MTTRGLKEEHMQQVADWMKSAIDNREDESKLADLRAEVKAFVQAFPLPSDS